jgi:hypothetical protein
MQSISGVSAINPLVAFYDIHGEKREVLFFYFVADTTRDPTRCSHHVNLTQYTIKYTILLLLMKTIIRTFLHYNQADSILPYSARYLVNLINKVRVKLSIL